MPYRKSITAIGLALVFAISAAPASAFDFYVCPVDVACEGWRWNELTTAAECHERYNYCIGINKCWGWNKPAVKDYRNRVIIPSFNHCLERVDG